ncbi:hypothetical protein [Candidatus Venteria ishoeyi]|uniref:Uncharacterized protein n=1 Tax=Candidatus Venteria ishoeyi TaxID=1899563 RepID=A0A1H6FB15_9GAMM|nr:hypothetical protein [Candidatus Venteria ishoeyi]SEH06519.1 Uncharacterised protein [Candidatus Venteria ishoeyi]
MMAGGYFNPFLSEAGIAGTSSLHILDYCDLYSIKNINLSKRINAFYLLEIAWEFHRRHILYALDKLVYFSKNSVNDRLDDKVLYGTQKSRIEIRENLSSVLADIGLISISSIHNILYQLIADSNINIQLIAVNAISQWLDESIYTEENKYLFDIRTTDVFDFLSNWHSGEVNIRTFSDEIGKESFYNEKEHLHSVLVLLLGEIANKNEILNSKHKGIEKIFKESILSLSKSSSYLVIDRLQYALPKILNARFHRMKSYLHKLVNHELIAEVVFKFLVAYYNFHSDDRSKFEIEEMLRGWESILKFDIKPTNKLLISTLLAIYIKIRPYKFFNKIIELYKKIKIDEYKSICVLYVCSALEKEHKNFPFFIKELDFFMKNYNHISIIKEQFLLMLCDKDTAIKNELKISLVSDISENSKIFLYEILKSSYNYGEKSE